MSTQHGLFPKIMNLRVENQTVPNSAHSNGHGNQMQQAGSNQITSAAAMNILKHSGGHISGMSNHHGQHNLAGLNERQHSRGIPMVSADGDQSRTAHQSGFGGTGSLPLKPLSSPRTSQQHNGGIILGQQDKGQGGGNPSSDPNALYQQQLQWKTKSSLNTQNGEELKASQGMPGAVTRASDSTIIVNGSKNGQPVVSSPGPPQGPGAS